MKIQDGPVTFDKNTEFFYLNLAKDFIKRMNVNSTNEVYNPMVS